MNGACTVSHSTVRMQYKAKPIHTIILEHGPLIIHGLGRVLVAYLIGACLRSQHPGFFPPPTRVGYLQYLSGCVARGKKTRIYQSIWGILRST